MKSIFIKMFNFLMVAVLGLFVSSKVEVGGSVNALSVGFQFGIGIKDGEFYYSSGIALLFGYDFYIRVKFS